MSMVNVEITSIGAFTSCGGITLVGDDDPLCPPLLPGEVVSVPPDHFLASDSRCNLTAAEATRPLKYGSLEERVAAAKDPAKMKKRVSTAAKAKQTAAFKALQRMKEREALMSMQPTDLEGLKGHDRVEAATRNKILQQMKEAAELADNLPPMPYDDRDGARADNKHIREK